MCKGVLNRVDLSNLLTYISVFEDSYEGCSSLLRLRVPRFHSGGVFSR